MGFHVTAPSLTIANLLGTLVLSVVLLVPGAAAAATEEAAFLILERTSLKTESLGFVIDNLPTDAFTPTTVVCPGAATCVIRVEVSATFEAIEPESVAIIRVQIDGSSVGVSPNSVVEVDSTSVGTLSNARTFSWMKTEVPAGLHTVDVDFLVGGAGAPAIAGARMLTVQVFRYPRVIIPPFTTFPPER